MAGYSVLLELAILFTYFRFQFKPQKIHAINRHPVLIPLSVVRHRNRMTGL